MTNCHPRNTSGGQKNDIGVQGMKRIGKPCSFGNESTIDDDRQGTRHRDPIPYPRTGKMGRTRRGHVGNRKRRRRNERRTGKLVPGVVAMLYMLHATTMISTRGNKRFSRARIAE